MGLFSILLAISAPQSQRIAPEDAVRKVVACGFAADRVRARYDALLDEQVVVVADGAAPSAAMLECSAKVSLAASYYVVFPAAVDRRYQPMYRSLEAQDSLVRAQTWLAARGLSGKVPVYDPQRESLASFAPRLEAVCGVEPGLVLRARAGALSMDVDVLAGGAVDDAAFHCLQSVITVTRLPFGFAANEAVADPDD